MPKMLSPKGRQSRESALALTSNRLRGQRVSRHQKSEIINRRVDEAAAIVSAIDTASISRRVSHI